MMQIAQMIGRVRLLPNLSLAQRELRPPTRQFIAFHHLRNPINLGNLRFGRGEQIAQMIGRVRLLPNLSLAQRELRPPARQLITLHLPRNPIDLGNLRFGWGSE